MLVFGSLAILGMIVLPIVLASALRRRFMVPWWLFCVGMATFVVSQAYHLPLNRWLTDIGLLGDISPQDPALARTALIAGLSAALCESLARSVGYWILFRTKKAERWVDSLMVGLGHGGIEAMGFVAVLMAATITSLWVLEGTDLSSLQLSPEQLIALERQMATLTQSPWRALVSLLERGMVIVFHVVISVLIWSGFSRRRPFYLVVAVLYHALLDGTAVYASQHIENAWIMEGILAVVILPGAIWAWGLRPGAEAERSRRARARAAMPSGWALFALAVRKELLYQWRTRRVIVVGAVFVLFGLGSPLLARFTPELLRGLEGVEQFAELIPTPTTADALGQYIKNLTQFGFILAILLGMGAVAGEKSRGTAAIILSKPMPRWAFVLSKFLAQALVYLVALFLAALGAYYYTAILFEPLAFGPFMFGNLLLLVWLLIYAAATLVGSTIARTIGAAAGIGFGLAVLLLLAGSLPRVGALAPSGLVAWAGQLGLASDVVPNGGALVAGLVVIVVCLITAVAVFETQEL